MIKLSFSQGNSMDLNLLMQDKEEEVDDIFDNDEDEEKIPPLRELIIISHDNRLYAAWLVLETFIQLGSSYCYAYLATFNINGKYQEDQNRLMLYFESFFLISMILKFLVEFKPDGSTIYVRDLREIAIRYLNGQFINDLIPLFPFAYIFDLDGHANNLLMIKCSRMIVGFKIFNVGKIMGYIKARQTRRLQKIIDTDYNRANDRELDQN